MTQFQPFYIGQKVVAVDAIHGSQIINGREYTITDCHYSLSGNPIAHGKSFWYVGVAGINNRWLRPGIFAPIIENFQSITLERVLETETCLISNN